MDFEEIYKANWPKVFRLCMGYVNDHDWAKDIAQETFIAVWQQLPNFRHESSVSTWVFRIASNNCLRQLQRDKRMPKTILPNELEDGEKHDKEEATILLYKCIAELSDLDRIIISLELEDLPQAEIAAVTGLSDSNIRVRIHRIKEKLTKKFKEYGYQH